jgi:hypothetical protein
MQWQLAPVSVRFIIDVTSAISIISKFLLGNAFPPALASLTPPRKMDV